MLSRSALPKFPEGEDSILYNPSFSEGIHMDREGIKTSPVRPVSGSLSWSTSIAQLHRRTLLFVLWLLVSVRSLTFFCFCLFCFFFYILFYFSFFLFILSSRTDNGVDTVSFASDSIEGSTWGDIRTIEFKGTRSLPCGCAVGPSVTSAWQYCVTLMCMARMVNEDCVIGHMSRDVSDDTNPWRGLK